MAPDNHLMSERRLFMRNHLEQAGLLRFYRGIRVAVILFAAVFFPIAAEADTALPSDTDTLTAADSLPVYHLGEIITVRGRKDIPISSVSEVLSPTLKTQGITTVPGALSSAPGVIVTSGSKGEARLQVRGFQATQTLVLYDGRPMALPYYGDLDLSVIPLGNVSRIGVIKGPAPVLYGANSMGGVVNIVSQRVVGRPIRRVRLSLTEQDGYDALLNYGAAAGRLDWWLSSGYSSSDGFDLSDDFVPNSLEDGALRYNSDSRHFNVDGKLNYSLPNGTIVSLSAGLYDAERGLPSGTDRAQYQRYPLWRRWYADLGADGWMGSRIYWKGKLYYDDCENRLQRYSDSAMTEENLDFDSYHDSYDLGAVFNTTLNLNPKSRNAVNISLRRDVIDRQSDRGEPWVHNSTSLFSVSDHFKYLFTPAWRAEIGAGASLMTSQPEETSTDALDLSGGVIYSSRPWLDLHLALSRVTRFPTLNQLYSSTSGNPDLRPEQAFKTEIGYRARITGRLTLDQAYFRSDVENLIDRRDRNSLYENLEEVDLSGLETGVSYDCRYWQARFDYMYLHAYEYNVEEETTTKDRRSHSPRHKIDFSLSANTAGGLAVGLSGQSIIDRVDSDREEMKDYFLVHIRAAYSFLTELDLFVNIRNLFDVDYEEERYYPMAGRVISVGVEADF